VDHNANVTTPIKTTPLVRRNVRNSTIYTTSSQVNINNNNNDDEFNNYNGLLIFSVSLLYTHIAFALDENVFKIPQFSQKSKKLLHVERFDYANVIATSEGVYLLL
jgi:hypothetical protein